MPDNILKDIAKLSGKESPKIVGTYQSPTEIGGSQYDKGFLPVYGDEQGVLNKIRARRQTNWDSFGNMLTRGLGKALITVPETLGYLADIPEMIGITDDYDNKISELSRQGKSWLDEQMPEYSRQIADSGFKPLEAEWWFRNGDSVVESLGYLIPGYAVGRTAGTALRLLKASGDVQKYGSAISAAVGLNYAETMQTAGDHYRESVKLYKQNGYSEEEARQLASDEASSIVWQGKVNTLFEFPAMMSLFKSLSKLPISSRALKGVESGTYSIGRELAKQAGSEYLEEVGLGFIQSEQERKRDIKLGKEVEEGNTLARLVNYAFSDQGLTEGLMGALGGGLFGAMAVKGQKEEYNKQQNLVKELTGKNSEEITKVLKDIGQYNKKEANAAKLGDTIGYNVAQEQKLNVLAAMNAKAGTFSQFLDNLDLAAEAVGDTTNLDNYKKQARYVEKIVNQVESQYSGYSPEYKDKVIDSLVNQRVYQNTVGKLNKDINQVYQDNVLDTSILPNLNLLYNKKQILERTLNKAKGKELEFTKAKLEEVNKQIEEQVPYTIEDTKEGTIRTPNDISMYSNPVVDSLVQPLVAQEIKYQYEAQEAVNTYKDLVESPEKAQEKITKEQIKEKRKETEELIKETQKKVEDASIEESKEIAKTDLETPLAEAGYSPEEIEDIKKDIEETVLDKERELVKDEETKKVEESITEGVFDNYVEPELPLEIDEIFGEVSEPESLPVETEPKIEPEAVFEVRPEPGLASTSKEFLTTKDNKIIYDENGKPKVTGQEEEFDFGYLNSPELNVGSEVELYVDRDSLYSQQGKGNTPETLHIKIRANGKIVGNLKNFRPTGDSVEDTKTLEVRKYLFDNQDKVLTTKVREKTKGFILNSKVIEGNKLVPAKNSIKSFGKPILAIPTNSTDGMIKYQGKNYGPLTKGKVYALIPSANGDLIPIAVNPRKFTKKESQAIVNYIRSNFYPTETSVDKLKKGDNVIIEGMPYSVVSKGESLIVFSKKQSKEYSFPLETTVYLNNYLNNKEKLEDYINFPSPKVNFTQDRLILPDKYYKYDEYSDDFLSDKISELYFDVSNKKLQDNAPFTSLTGKEYSSYTDFIVDNNFYTTDLDANRPFYGAAIYLEEPVITQATSAEIAQVEPEVIPVESIEDKDALIIKAIEWARKNSLPNTAIEVVRPFVDKYLTNPNQFENIALDLVEKVNSQDAAPQLARNFLGNFEYMYNELQEEAKEETKDEIKEAVKEVNKADLFGGDESIRFTKPKVFGEGQASIPTAPKDLLQFGIDNSTEATKRVGNKLLEMLDKGSPTVKILNDLKEIKEIGQGDIVWLAYSSEENTIKIPYTAIEDLPTNILAEAIVHEFTHAYTEGVLIKSQVTPDKLDVNERRFVDTINELYNYSKQFISSDNYGMSNVSEFLAELSNPLFSKQLEAIKVDKKRNVFQKIIDAILKLLGFKIEPSDSVYSKAFKSLSDYLKTASKVTPEVSGEIRYARIPNVSRVEQKRRLDTINFMFVKAALNLIKKGPYSFEYLTKLQVKEIYDAIKESLESQSLAKNVIDNWDLFVSESKKSLVDFGFLYREDGDTMDIDDTTKESWQVKPFEDNLKDSLSKQLKLYLRFIEKVDKEGKYIKDDLGRNTFLPYDEISIYLAKNLADLDTNQQKIDKILELSEIRPELKRIYIDLTTDLTSENFKNNFFTNFSKTKVKFITVLSEGKDDSSVSKVINTSRKNLAKDILEEWKITYQRELKDNKPDIDKVNKVKGYISKVRYGEFVTDEQADNISKALVEIGISMPANRFRGMNQENISKYITGPSSVNTLFDSLSKGYDIFNVVEEKVTKGEGKTLRKLAELEAQLRPEDITPSVVNGENNRIYALQNNTAISKEVRRLKKDVSNYLTDPFYKLGDNINWGIERLMTDREFRENFEVAVFDSERLNLPGRKGTPYSNINPSLWNKVKINSVLNQGNKYGWFPFPTPADKENIYFAYLPKHRLTKDGDSLSKESLAMYNKIVLAETARIFNAHKELFNWEEKDLIAGYHYKSSMTPKEAKERALEGVFSGKAFEYHIFKELNDLGYNKKALKTTKFLESEQQEIDRAINTYFNRRVNETIESFKETEIISETNGVYSNIEIDVSSLREYNGIKDAIENYVFNVQMGYWFIDSILLGDPAFTKSYDDYTKRVALWQTPGTDIGDGQYTVTVVRDILAKSKYAESYKKALSDIGVTKEKIDEIIGTDGENPSGYYDINQTDAQGLCTWNRYLDIMTRQGNLRPELTENLDRIAKGEITPEEANILFAPVKGTNIGYRIVNGKRVPVAVKYSLTPILPSFRKYPKFAKLLDNLEREGIDELIFESGFKLGTQQLGQVNNPRSWNKIMLNNDSYRIPQVVPYKDTGKTLLPTQSMKNIIVNISPESIYNIGGDLLDGSKLIKEYQEVIAQNIKEDFKKVTNKLKVGTSEYLGKLQKLFLSEANRRNNLPDNYIEALDIVGDDFRVPLSFPLFSSTRENMFFSVFKKKVSTRKVPGFSAVNVSDFATTYDQDNKLQFYTVNYTDPVDSQEFTIEAAEIAVSQDYFRNIIKAKYPEYNLEGDIDLNKIPEDLRYMIANRIPNQAKNSMVMCKVVSLLPKEAASQIMLPKEGTRQGGYDFDIDKSFILTKNFKIVDGEFKTIKYYSKPEDTKIRYGQYLEELAKADKVKEILREYKIDLQEQEDIYFVLGNELEGKLNEILSIDSSSIEDEEYYELLTDYLSMEGITEEEFSKLSIIEQNTKQARENRIVDFYIGILSSSHNFYESILPNNMDTLASVRKKILQILKPLESGRDIINDYQQSLTREKNQAGKQLVGVHSNSAVARPYLQIVGYESPTPAHFDGRELFSMSNFKDYKGNFITDNHLELQTAAVDNAKDPILGDLNDNIYTADVWDYLVDLGVPLETISYFMTQPILVELSKRWNNGGRTTSAAETAFRELTSEYLANGTEETNVNNLNTEDLIEQLKAPDNTYQLNVLNKFYDYKKASKEYTNLIQALRADSVRTLPSIVENQLYMDRYNQNITPEMRAELPMVEAFTKYGIEEPLRLSGDLFIWTSKLFNDLRDTFSTIQSDFLTKDIIEALNYDLFSYIYTLPGSPLSYANPKEYLYGAEDKLPLADRIKALQQEERKKLLENSNYVMNPFIMSLSEREVKAEDVLYEDGVRITKSKVDYKLVIFDDTSGSRTRDQKSQISDSWYELFLDDKTTDLAWDLAVYSFFINGFDKGAYTFMDYIPIKMLEDMGVIEYYKKIEGAIKAGNSLDIDLQDFIEKFTRNTKNQGLGFIKRVKKEGKRIIDGVLEGDLLKVEDNYTIQTPQGTYYPRIIGLPDKGLRLFKFYKTTEGKGLYKEINNLGTNIIREYLPGKQIESIFVQNNKTKEEVISEDNMIPNDIRVETKLVEPTLDIDSISDSEAINLIKKCNG